MKHAPWMQVHEKFYDSRPSHCTAVYSCAVGSARLKSAVHRA